MSGGLAARAARAGCWTLRAHHAPPIEREVAGDAARDERGAAHRQPDIAKRSEDGHLLGCGVCSATGNGGLQWRRWTDRDRPRGLCGDWRQRTRRGERDGLLLAGRDVDELRALLEARGVDDDRHAAGVDPGMLTREHARSGAHARTGRPGARIDAHRAEPRNDDADPHLELPGELGDGMPPKRHLVALERGNEMPVELLAVASVVEFLGRVCGADPGINHDARRHLEVPRLARGRTALGGVRVAGGPGRGGFRGGARRRRGDGEQADEQDRGRRQPGPQRSMDAAAYGDRTGVLHRLIPQSARRAAGCAHSRRAR